MKGVLGNFLGTYLSRYSDYGGYWLFGFLVDDFGELRIDLLAPPVTAPGRPESVVIASAAAKFKTQLDNAGLEQSRVRAAYLTIQRMSGQAAGLINGSTCPGCNLRFIVETIVDGGRRYEREQVIFVAPHNAAIERQSTRSAEP